MNKTAFKIAISIIIVTILSLLVVNTLTAYQAERAFDSFLHGQEEYGFRVLPSMREIQTQLRLESDFRDRLYQSIAIVSIGAMVAAFVLGLFIARVITRPLRLLRNGIRNLRENKSSKIYLTGNEEVDEVIIEFNKLADELDFQEVLRSNLIADISHEFKTPLTSLTGQIHGIRDGVFEATEERFEIINDQIERLTELVSSLQNYTHMQSELRKLKRSTFNLCLFLNKQIKAHEASLSQSNIKYNIICDSDIKIYGDKQKFSQVVDNIVVNTIKYSGAKSLTVTVNKEKRKIIISDDGKGVSEKDLKLLFERFYRVEKSRNRKTGGLGLGLAIVKDIINAHGWIISAKSGKNKGLTYEISLFNDLKLSGETVHTKQNKKTSGNLLTRISSKKQ